MCHYSKTSRNVGSAGGSSDAHATSSEQKAQADLEVSSASQHQHKKGASASSQTDQAAVSVKRKRLRGAALHETSDDARVSSPGVIDLTGPSAAEVVHLDDDDDHDHGDEQRPLAERLAKRGLRVTGMDMLTGLSSVQMMESSNTDAVNVGGDGDHGALSAANAPAAVSAGRTKRSRAALFSSAELQAGLEAVDQRKSRADGTKRVKRPSKASTQFELQQRLMLQRSCRLLVHELAHLFGFEHCIYYACCMNGYV